MEPATAASDDFLYNMCCTAEMGDRMYILLIGSRLTPDDLAKGASDKGVHGRMSCLGQRRKMTSPN